MLGASYKGIPIQYAKQEYDSQKRDAPWGTLDALCAGIKFINGPFVVCNSDDIYGENALFLARSSLEKTGQNLAVGYQLGKVLPQKGSVNRGIFRIDNDYIRSIKEEISLTRENILERGFSPETLCSMNLFGLTAETLRKLELQLHEFKQKNTSNRNVECLLPQEIGKLIEEKAIAMKILQTNDRWLGITNPEDEEQVRKELIRKI